MNPNAWKQQRGRWNGRAYATLFVVFLMLVVIVACGLIWWLA